MTPGDAERAARVEAGGIEEVKEAVRDVRVGAAVGAAIRDACHGARVFRRAPGYAFIVVATIALGIGVNAATFSVVHAVLWRSLPYPEPHRIVAIEADTDALPSAYSSSAAVFDVRAESRLIASVAQVEGRDASLEMDGVMEHVMAARVTDDVLPLLGGVPLAAGRPLTASADLNGVRVTGVVISHDLWQRRFHGDPDVVGRRLTVNNMTAHVVGVMPPDFRLVMPGASHVEERVDLLLPKDFAPSLMYRGLPLLGRLVPGTTVAEAQAELDALAARFVATHALAYPQGLRVTVRPLGEVVIRDVKPALMALAGAVGFVILIACVNVANLILARAKTRERELAVRRALGATRPRLLAQLLTEHLVMALLGGACGLLLAWWAVGALDWLRVARLPRQSDIAIDGGVVLWTVGLTLVSTLVFGIVPALALTRDGQGQPLQGSRSGSLHLRSRRLQRGLVLAEVALSIVPLMAAGLLLRTFVNLLDAPIGFEPSNVVTARVSLDLQRFRTVDSRSAFYDAAIARVRALPGVEAASVGGPLPLAPVQASQQVWPADEPPAGASMSLQQSVMPGYLDVLKIPLRAGRDISADDIRHRRRVVIVDERLAAQLWDGDAIGRHLGIGESGEPLEVVGVAGAIRGRAMSEAGSPTIYVPSHVYEIEQTLVVRTRAAAAAIRPAIARAVEGLGPGRPVFEVRSLQDIAGASIDGTRFTMIVLSLFAAASLVLAGVGLYGTLAYLTLQRTQEFGVRLACGASARSILGLVLFEGWLFAAAGVAVGLAGALVVARMLQPLLYGVSTLDSVTVTGITALLAVVVTLAIGGPAWRASRIDPTTALRAD